MKQHDGLNANNQIQFFKKVCTSLQHHIQGTAMKIHMILNLTTLQLKFCIREVSYNSRDRKQDHIQILLWFNQHISLTKQWLNS